MSDTPAPSQASSSAVEQALEVLHLLADVAAHEHPLGEAADRTGDLPLDRVALDLFLLLRERALRERALRSPGRPEHLDPVDVP